MVELYKIHEKDNVAVDLNTGTKYALCDICSGGEIIKYGYSIGVARKNIVKGEAVHTDNLATGLSLSADYSGLKARGKPSALPVGGRTFEGFARRSGSVGIRNDIFIIPTVGCVNALCRNIRNAAVVETGTDNIRVFEHNYGCSQLGDDHENTRLILKNLALHPNAGGVLIVALGCENNTLESFKALLGDYERERVRFLCAQDDGDELKAGVREVKDLLMLTAKDKRTTLNIERLVVGLKCGGSDALSGITANPLLGELSEMLTGLGASVIMTEVPEMFGAEHILMQNAKDENVKQKIYELVTGFKRYFAENGESVSENPSPGNKEGGITTLEEKSLGCVQKGGNCTVTDVLSYGETVKARGLTLLEGPGNDIVAVTALAAAGAHMILFTTGRGTPLGGPVPVLKVSSNTALARKKPAWVDFDAGRMIGMSNGDGVLAEELFDLITDIACGKPVKTEINGYADFAVWKKGVTL